jgi:hypothetical protein
MRHELVCAKLHFNMLILLKLLLIVVLLRVCATVCGSAASTVRRQCEWQFVAVGTAVCSQCARQCTAVGGSVRTYGARNYSYIYVWIIIVVQQSFRYCCSPPYIQVCTRMCCAKIIQMTTTVAPLFCAVRVYIWWATNNNPDHYCSPRARVSVICCATYYYNSDNCSPQQW